MTKFYLILVNDNILYDTSRQYSMNIYTVIHDQITSNGQNREIIII